MTSHDISNFAGFNWTSSTSGSIPGRRNRPDDGSHQTCDSAETDDEKLSVTNLCVITAKTVGVMTLCISLHWAALSWVSITGF